MLTNQERFNQGFTSKTLSDRQVEVTNNLGRDVDEFEIVFLDGYFGEVREHGGIADTETGRINIDHERLISTAQMTAADTFVAGNVAYFAPGGAGAAGEIRDEMANGRIAVGIITAFGGAAGAHTWVELRPFTQRGESGPARELKVTEFEVDADATAGLTVDVPRGALVVDMWNVCTAANAGGTVKLNIIGGADVVDAMAMAVDNALTRGAVLNHANRVVPAAGVEVTTAAAGDRGLVYVAYI